MKQYHVFLIVIIVGGLFACDKNSNQLPPIIKSETVNLTVNYNNIQCLQAEIYQSLVPSNDSLRIKFKNVFAQPIDSACILLEIVKDSTITYDSEKIIRRINLSSLTNEKTQDFGIFVGDGTNIKYDKLKLYLLFLNSANYSNSLSSNCQGNILDTSNTIVGKAQGYISADGQTNFYLKNDGKHQKLLGSFTDSTSFNGYLLNSENKNQDQVTLDTSPTNNNNDIILKFKLESIENQNISYLIFKLQKI